MALLGRPKNGDIVRAQLRIKESKEFKVSDFTVNYLKEISNSKIKYKKLFKTYFEKLNETIA
jgi:hypothetical protein